APAAAPPHDHRGERAYLPRPPGERRVAGRQEDQGVQVRTSQGERAGVVHLEKVIGSAAVRAREVFDRRDDEEVGARPRSARRLAHASSPATAASKAWEMSGPNITK